MGKYVWSDELCSKTALELPASQAVSIRAVGDGLPFPGTRNTAKALLRKELVVSEHSPFGPKFTLTINGAGVYAALCKQRKTTPRKQPNTAALVAELKAAPLEQTNAGNDVPQVTSLTVVPLATELRTKLEAFAPTIVAATNEDAEAADAAHALTLPQLIGLGEVANGRTPGHVKTTQSLHSRELIEFSDRDGVSVIYQLTGWGRRVLAAARGDKNLKKHVKAERPKALKGSRLAPDGRNFPWGPVVATHEIGRYAIVEYLQDQSRNIHAEAWASHGEPLFAVYIAGENGNRNYPTLEEALIGALAIDGNGHNTQADRLIARMLGWETQS